MILGGIAIWYEQRKNRIEMSKKKWDPVANHLKYEAEAATWLTMKHALGSCPTYNIWSVVRVTIDAIVLPIKSKCAWRLQNYE